LVVEVDNGDWRYVCGSFYEFGNLAMDPSGVVVGKLMKVDMEDFEGECKDVVDDGSGIGGKGLEEGATLDWLCEDLCGEDPRGGIRVGRRTPLFEIEQTKMEASIVAGEGGTGNGERGAGNEERGECVVCSVRTSENYGNQRWTRRTFVL
jgi:hypothetical protein